MNQQTLDLRDIHLPEPISWWPIAPGWWIILACIFILVIAALVAKNIYNSKKLKREIAAELDEIKQRFNDSHNKSQLAKSLSILLRRANISLNPTLNISGLTGDSWLNWLDDSHNNTNSDLKFQSDIGKVLLDAPYLPEQTDLDFDAQALIQLCESWLLSSHNSSQASRS